MIATCIAVMLSLSLPPSTCEAMAEQGWASRYSAGVMEATVEVRQHQLEQLPLYTNRYDGYVATLGCEFIGKVVLVRPSPRTRWHQMLVADCARRDDGDGTRTWMSENNILVELDYPTAVLWKGLRGGIEIEVVFDCHPLCNHVIKRQEHHDAPGIQPWVTAQYGRDREKGAVLVALSDRDRRSRAQ